MPNLFRFAFGLAALALTQAAPLHAQEFPTRPIRLIVPFTPGGGNDVLARLIADRFNAVFKQPTVVENRAGAGGNIGADVVAKAPADGQTLLLGNVSLAMIPHILKDTPFDARSDFTVLAIIASTPFGMVVPAVSPLNSVADVIAKAKADPGRMIYASVGLGTPHHLGMELFQLKTGTKMQHVVFKGSAPALSDLAASQFDLMLISLNAAAPFLQRKQIRVLAVGEPNRLADMPDVPTFVEQGVPDFEVTAWYGVIARSGLPPAVAARLSTEILDAVKNPELAKRLKAAGFDVTPIGPEAAQKRLLADYAAWGDVVKNAGIKAE